MRALGAKVINTPTELGMKQAIQVAEEMKQQIPRSYIPNQFANDWNPDTYYHTLGPEIWKDIDGQIAIYVAGAGDRKSTRQNSSHVANTHPVCCLTHTRRIRST